MIFSHDIKNDDKNESMYLGFTMHCEDV